MDDIEKSFVELVDIDSIEEDTYYNMVDLSVEDDQSFVLSNGFISHNSAVAGFSSVRNPEVHGGLGLRGKVLNVNGEVPKRVLDNSTLVDIMNSLGLMIGEKAQRDYMRYGKVYIAADQDPDGHNITALLINFLYSYWPELFDPKQDPFVHVFMTPFIIAEKGKERKYWYAHDHHEFDPEKWKGWGITRAKGLGSLTREDWRHSINNLVAIPILDDGKMESALDLIFNGSRADDRKAWISLHKTT